MSKSTANINPRSADPDGLSGMAAQYIEWMQVVNYSKYSVKSRRQNLNLFITWCQERSLFYPSEITKPIVERYQRYLFHYRKKNDKPLSVSTQHSRLDTIRAYFKWLARNNHILYNPASDIVMPRIGTRLPLDVLTAREAEQILTQPDVTDPVGIRDRALLETLYSTGMRRLEVVQLTIYNIDLDGGTVMVREGKGKKDRVVPIGERAVRWIERYLFDVRPLLSVEPDHGALFLTTRGAAFSPDILTRTIRAYVERADIGKKGACHLFRHTMATLMLENGADLRTIQQILGHASLESTQVYTHLTIKTLKEVHQRTHPGHLVRKELDQELSDALAEDDCPDR